MKELVLRRLDKETEKILGKSFTWKRDRLIVEQKVKVILRISTTKYVDKESEEKYFPLAYTKFKEEDRKINGSKDPEWMDAKLKIKEVDISYDNRPISRNVCKRLQGPQGDN